MINGEYIVAFDGYYQDRSVLVTGDTGFKGFWLAFWLTRLGARVHGLALDPHTDPSGFVVLKLDEEVEHCAADIRDADSVRRAISRIKPDVIFHLAAQALVRTSYRLPLVTLDTNVMGTANLLQAVLEAGYSESQPCNIVVVTSDKCYENHETYYGYREEDAVGGHDVYSMSKGAAELVVASWRRSFFPPDRWPAHGISLASVRAGNVIGGGDWAEDRIVVDCVRALSEGRAIGIRNPKAVRPWQHVLEPLSGYLHLAARMGTARGSRPDLMSAWNFGPGREAERNVKELVDIMIESWGSGSWEQLAEENAVHEANYLKLATDKAWHLLRWKSTWDFETSIRRTAEWYKTAQACEFSSRTMRCLTASQIEEYTSEATREGLSWSKNPQ